MLFCKRITLVMHIFLISCTSTHNVTGKSTMSIPFTIDMMMKACRAHIQPMVHNGTQVHACMYVHINLMGYAV
jgi:hypothetical protein